jgi:hypothetical protein
MTATTAPAGRRLAPILTLAFLAPIISEVLFGSTPVSRLFLLLPQTATYGCAALLSREIARRTGGGWRAILLLGLAWAVAEEFLIIQTSVTPLIGVDPARTYGGRALGVSWVYLVWALGYISIWSILIPIQLVELIYPDRRDQPWLRTPGIVAAIVFLIAGSLMAWYGWTHMAEPRIFGRRYDPPVGWVVAAVVSIVGLVVGASRLRPAPERTREGSPPEPTALGLAGFGLGAAWVGLLLLAYGVAPKLPVGATYAIAGLLALVGWTRIRRWSSSPAFGDRHRVALIIGALVASMAVGFVATFAISSRLDIAGKVVLNVLALALLLVLARRIGDRKARSLNPATRAASAGTDDPGPATSRSPVGETPESPRPGPRPPERSRPGSDDRERTGWPPGEARTGSRSARP